MKKSSYLRRFSSLKDILRLLPNRTHEQVSSPTRCIIYIWVLLEDAFYEGVF